MKSLPVVVLALCAILGLAAWLFLGRAEDEAPAPSGTSMPEGKSKPDDGPRMPTERSEVVRPPDPTNEPAQAPPPAAEPPGQPVASAAANVHLIVRSAATKQPVPVLRWRVRQAGQKAELGTATDGRADLALPPGTTVELLVESDGYSPFTAKNLAIPATNAPPLDLEIFLEAAAVATGITLHVHDTGLQPVQNVRVEAYPLRPENRDLAWHVLEKALWVRRTQNAEGTYVLPELAAGEYGIRVLATDAEGELLPLLPFARIYLLTGSNGFVEDVTLEPGCVPLLDLQDPSGQPIDPQKGAVTLGLRQPGGPMIARHWLQKRDTGTVRALDALPGTGVVWPGEAVAPGTWQFEVQIDGQPALQQQLFLRAGERQAERVIVPR